eukprot:389128-Prorocentrum_lima.AAC.1
MVRPSWWARAPGAPGFPRVGLSGRCAATVPHPMLGTSNHRPLRGAARPMDPGRHTHCGSE